jgi:pyrroloquinoline-quinone synthase
MADLARVLDAVVGERPLLEHPFYQAWSEGKLTAEDLAFYSTQYWLQVEALPGYLEALADRLPDGDVRRIVTDNLSDERDGDHAGLWKAFAAALGVGDDALDSAAPEPETRSCVEAFSDAARDTAIPFALGMLYGYESQTPAVSKTKVRGLREHYGIDGAGLDYFELHADLDVEHAGELASALARYTETAEGLQEAGSGARAGAEAVWTLLDGVARVRGIA